MEKPDTFSDRPTKVIDVVDVDHSEEDDDFFDVWEYCMMYIYVRIKCSRK